MYVRVGIRGLEMLVFRKILATYLMDGPKLSGTYFYYLAMKLSLTVLFGIVHKFHF